MRFLRFLAAWLLVSLCAPIGMAFAWGSVYEDRVLEAAVDALEPAWIADVAGDPALWDETTLWSAGGTGPSHVDPVETLDRQYAELVEAFASDTPYRVAAAMRALLLTVGSLWQPMHAAGVFDPAGTRPGFHFRYETILAERLADVPLALGTPRLLDQRDVVAGAIRADRAAVVDGLAAVESAALVASGDRYDAIYYDALWQDLGADLVTSAESSAQLLADLVHTAWVDAGRPRAVAAPNGPIRAMALSPNPARSATTLRFELQSSARVIVEIVHVSGRVLRRIDERALGAGRHEVVIADEEIRRLASGTYFVRARSAQGGAARKLVVVR